MGSSVIATDSGKELQCMACEGSELGREVDLQQNSFAHYKQCTPDSLSVGWFLRRGCCLLAR